MDKKGVLVLIGALLLASATAATAYSRFSSPQQLSQGTDPGATTGYAGWSGMMGGGMMGHGMTGWGYGGQHAASAGYSSTNATAGWNWQEMWSWCRNMMSGLGLWFTGSSNSSVEG